MDIQSFSSSKRGFSARLMMDKGSCTIPGSLGTRSPKQLHVVGKSMDAVMMSQGQTKEHCMKETSPCSSPPPSKSSKCKDTHSLWKSVQDCHASLTVANPRHFEFAVANLCFLLKAYGKELDDHVRIDIDQIFQTIRSFALDPSKRPTTRMQLLKVIELRARRWTAEEIINGQYVEKQAKAQSLLKPETPADPSLKKKQAKTPAGSSIVESSKSASSSKADTPGNIKQYDPSRKSTGFREAMATSPEVLTYLSTIPEETPSDVPSQNLSCNSLLHKEMEKHNVIPLKDLVVDKTSSVIGNATDGLSNSSSSRPENAGRAQLSSESSCGSNQLLQYSRDFLLKCWDSPACRVMPASLEHTIPHSDIYYIIRIPTFEDPTFLLHGDITQQNRWDLGRMRHVSCPKAFHGAAKAPSGPSK